MLIDYIIGSKAREASRWLASTINIKAGLTEAQSKEGTALDVGLKRTAQWWSSAPGTWAVLLLVEFATRVAFSQPEIAIRGADLRGTLLASTFGALLLGLVALFVDARVISLRGSIADRLRESAAVELKARARELAAEGVNYIREALGKMELRVVNADALVLRSGDLVEDLIDGQLLVFVEARGGDDYTFSDAQTGEENIVRVESGKSIWSRVKRVDVIPDALLLRPGDVVWMRDGGRELRFVACLAQDVHLFRNTATDEAVEIHTGGGSIWAWVKRVAPAGKGAAS